MARESYSDILAVDGNIVNRFYNAAAPDSPLPSLKGSTNIFALKVSKKV
jgi:hypothetical protein